MLFFVCSEAAESKLVKLETSHTVILPPMVSVLWVGIPETNTIYTFSGLASLV